MRVSSEVARTASAGGKRLLKMTISGTQAAAATPVKVRPTSRPDDPCAVASR